MSEVKSAPVMVVVKETEMVSVTAKRWAAKMEPKMVTSKASE